MSQKLRLLYLGFAFPPGIQALHPSINIAGHGFETQMIRELRAHCEIRSVGVLPIEPPPLPGADPGSGIPHDLLLLERAPELMNRFRSLARLKRQYQQWRAERWEPDVVLAYNLSPIYDCFVRWLNRQSKRPQLVLLLADSAQLGKQMSFSRRFRHRFKPMVIPQKEMITYFDACIGLSQSVAQYFEPRNVPFLWMPGGVTPRRSDLAATESAVAELEGPIRFAYFGSLSDYAGVKTLIEAFERSSLKASLHICGTGRLEGDISAAAQRDPRLKYEGLMTQDECLKASQSWDVLVNPRPATHGNENNFPSKVFEYALCGRAILTTQMAGVEKVLGPEAYYFSPQELEAGINREFATLSLVPREELRRRGDALRKHIMDQYSWSRQATVIAEFMSQITRTKPAVR